MIRQEVVDGRKATAVYTDSRFNPAAADKALCVKLLFDNGDILFLRRSDQDEQKAFDEAEHPRDEHGKWTDAGGGGGGESGGLSSPDAEFAAAVVDKRVSDKFAKSFNAVLNKLPAPFMNQLKAGERGLPKMRAAWMDESDHPTASLVDGVYNPILHTVTMYEAPHAMKHNDPSGATASKLVVAHELMHALDEQKRISENVKFRKAFFKDVHSSVKGIGITERMRQEHFTSDPEEAVAELGALLLIKSTSALNKLLPRSTKVMQEIFKKEQLL